MGNPRKQMTPEAKEAREEAYEIHTVLDTVGYIPIAGEPADFINGIIYAAEKDYLKAGLAMAGVVPVVGEVAKAGKLGAKALELVDKVDDVAEVAAKGATNLYGKYSTKIDSKVTVVDKQDLPSWLIDTYKDRNYRTVVTNEDIKVYRSFGYNAEAGGVFATSNPSLSRVQTKVDSAILPEWKNTLQYEAEIVIPKCTTLNIGRVGEQYTMSGARLVGDDDQFLLPENWDLNWIKSIRKVGL